MNTTEYSFSTEQEIEVFLAGLAKSPEGITKDGVNHRADTMKFDTNQLRDYFIETGERLIR